MGDKHHRREGNSADHPAKAPNNRSVIKEVRVRDSQVVYLEAATKERVHNSSLIERLSAEVKQGQAIC